MGQYHITVNLDKRQYINPHEVGNGLKLLEQLGSNVPSAIFMLLAVSNGRGGGDFQDFRPGPDPKNPYEGGEYTQSELIGSWGGDRIVVIGDYAEPTDLPPEFEAEKLYGRCHPHDADCDIPADEHYRNISGDLRPLLERYMGIKFVSNDGWMHFVETCYEHPDRMRGHLDHEPTNDPFASFGPEHKDLTLKEIDRELRMGTPPEMLGISPEMAVERNNGWDRR